MATSTINGKDLLSLAKQLSAEEFDAFIEQALSLHPRPATTLSARETKLIKQINRGLSVKFRQRYAQLIARRKKGALTGQEHQELLQLTHQAESRDAERAAALVELAELRRLPVRVLMKQMGLKAPPIAWLSEG